VISGDFVIFNRAPTLYHSSMSAHKIIVNINEPSSYTFKLNTLACVLYSADFDGDQMNIVFGTSLMS